MPNSNIKIETLQLNHLIETLRQDNENIISAVERINVIVNKLDKEVWNSPEKQKIEDEFFVYLQSNVEYIAPLLRNCLKSLENVNQAYISQDIQQKNSTDNLSS